VNRFSGYDTNPIVDLVSFGPLVSRPTFG